MVGVWRLEKQACDPKVASLILDQQDKMCLFPH